MKSRVFVMSGCLFFMATLSACSPPVESIEPTAVPTNTTPPIVEEVSPTSTPVDVIMERPGHVRILQGGIQAQYLQRAFLQIPIGLDWGPDGKMYVGDWTGHHVVTATKDGQLDDLDIWQSRKELQADGPRGVAFDSKGNLFINNHGYILRIDPQGTVETLMGVGGSPIGSLAINADDELYFTDRGMGAVFHWNPEGRSELITRDIPNAENLVFGLDGTLYISQMNMDRVMVVDTATGDSRVFVEGKFGWDPIYLAVDAEGDIWVRGIGSLHQYAPDGTEKPFIVDGERYPGGHDLWHTSAGLAFDDEGGLWVASYTSKLLRLVPVEPGTPDPEFSSTVISSGLQVVDLAMGSEGEVYATDSNAAQLLRIEPDGNLQVLAEYGFAGSAAVAVDSEGAIFLGLPTSDLVQVMEDGSFKQIARVLTRRMVIGKDDAMYAVTGDYNQPKAISRITKDGDVQVLARAIDGVPLGNSECSITLAMDQGFYIFSEAERNLFFMDYEGNGRLITDLKTLGGGGPALFASSPINGEIFYIPHGPYTLFRLDQEGQGGKMAEGIFGDPWGMVVSPDGKWLYIAESGAIDKISLE